MNQLPLIVFGLDTICLTRILLVYIFILFTFMSIILILNLSSYLDSNESRKITNQLQGNFTYPFLFVNY